MATVLAGYSASDEILKGLAEQGLLTVSQQANGFSSVDVLEVTDKGQAVEFRDRKKWCLYWSPCGC